MNHIIRKMATDGMLKDAGAICRRLLNHRGALQSEIQLFVKEFEVRRGDMDVQALQNANRVTENVHTLHLPAIQEHGPVMDQVLIQMEEVRNKCDALITEGEQSLNQGLLEPDAESLAAELKMFKSKLEDQRSVFTNEHQTDMGALQAELEGIHTQMKKVQGRYDDILPPEPTKPTTATP